MKIHTSKSTAHAAACQLAQMANTTVAAYLDAKENGVKPCSENGNIGCSPEELAEALGDRASIMEAIATANPQI